MERLALVAIFLVLPSLSSAPNLQASPSPQVTDGSRLRESYAQVDSCWVRPDWPEAETMALPKKVCIQKVGVIVPITEGLPLGDGSELIVEGDPAVSGRLRISGAESRDGNWSVVGLFAQAHAKEGSTKESAVAVYVDIDEAGTIRNSAPRVHGVLINGGVVQILYAPAS